MSQKLRVAVLMGGRSPEHAISLISGAEVVKNLDRDKYEVLPITISRDGKSFKLDNRKYSPGQLSTAFRQKTRPNCQLFFIAMHGQYGEDGTIQGFLELTGVPYTGSKVLASALGMDKIYSRTLFTQVGLTVPSHIVVEKGEKPNKVWSKLKLPVFVKPANLGSSIGASLVRGRGDLTRALKLAFSASRQALVEEYLDGIEVTCSILGNDRPIALPLVEIVPKKAFFDYEAKYDPNLTDEIVPARLNKALTQKAQKAALVAYKTLGCQGFGRVDIIIKRNKVYVLEVNTIPGLTPASLFPKAAAAAGISYPQLLDKIISYALEN